MMLIDQILESFKHNSLVKSSETMDGKIHVSWVSPELKRRLEA